MLGIEYIQFIFDISRAIINTKKGGSDLGGKAQQGKRDRQRKISERVGDKHGGLRELDRAEGDERECQR